MTRDLIPTPTEFIGFQEKEVYALKDRIDEMVERENANPQQLKNEIAKYLYTRTYNNNRRINMPFHFSSVLFCKDRIEVILQPMGVSEYIKIHSNIKQDWIDKNELGKVQ